MDSGRVYIAVGKPLKFFVNPGGSVALPSVTNPADANSDTDWGFFELNNYLDPYITQVWQKYRTADQQIATQSSWGTVVGRVGADGLLRFPGICTSSKPSSHSSTAVSRLSSPPMTRWETSPRG